MAKIKVEIEFVGKLPDADEYSIQDAITDALKNLGFNVKNIKATQILEIIQ